MESRVTADALHIKPQVAIFLPALSFRSHPSIPLPKVFHSALDRFRRIVSPEPPKMDLALVLTGGGARSAYQAGVLKYIGEYLPHAGFSYYVGVSAGAINAALLASDGDSFRTATARMVDSWLELRSREVYRMEGAFSVLRAILAPARNERELPRDGIHALADTTPLRDYLKEKMEIDDGRLVGISRNVQSGRLKAAAIVTTNYMTGQTVTWVQGASFERWERPNRVGINTTLTIDHVMASTSLPFIFPAVGIGDAWYGDGGIRLAAPLAPAIHLGADRILAISTRYGRSRAEADEPVIYGYPPLSQIFGILTNAVFLDALDQDALILDRINRLVEALPANKRIGLKPIRLLLLRPTVDLGRLAADYKKEVAPSLGLLARALGTKETHSPDWLSMLLFESDYIGRLIDIGYEDARRQHHHIEQFFDAAAELPASVRLGHAMHP